MIVDGRVEGKIIYIWEEQSVGQSWVRKKTFVIEEDTDKEYKGSMAIDLIKDRVDMINEFKIWDFVKVQLNFRANEYNGKYYNWITAWKIDKADGSSSSSDWEDLPF